MKDKYVQDTDYRPTQLLVLVIDVSGSMDGYKLEACQNLLNDIFKRIQMLEVEEYVPKIELAIIQYDCEVKIVRNPQTIEEDEQSPILEAGGFSETIKAMETAIQLVEDRKVFYRSIDQSYYSPWIMIISDGEPCGEKASQADINAISQRVAEDTKKRRYLMVGVGIGESEDEDSVDMVFLTRATPITMTFNELKNGFDEIFPWSRVPSWIWKKEQELAEQSIKDELSALEKRMKELDSEDSFDKMLKEFIQHEMMKY